MEFLLSGEFREVKVSNTMNYDNWLAAGALKVEQNASKIVKEYLKEGNRNQLESGVIENFNRIIKRFESNIK